MFSITSNNRTIEIKNEQKVFFPNISYTKKDLITYYQKISHVMLPHIKDRPITMHRFPNGIQKQGFYQKEAPNYFPHWIQRVEVPVEQENITQQQITCQDEATLVYLANQACITPHIWLSKQKNIYKPDKIIFDLDPPRDNFQLVKQAAQSLRTLFETFGLQPYVMTTGSQGMHVAAPLQQKKDFDEIRSFAQYLAKRLVNQYPKKYTIEISKKKRKGRLFLDYLRNSYAQNSVTPYAVRPLPTAPVATPISWDELKDISNSQQYTVQNIFRRLGQKQDPWHDFFENQSLPPDF